MQNLNTITLLPLPGNIDTELRKIYNLDNPGRLEEAVNILKDWLQKQGHFLKNDYSTQYLEGLLIQCKGSIEKTKKQIDYISTFRTLLPKFFKLMNADELETNLQLFKETCLFTALPVLTSDLSRVFMFKFHKYPNDSEKFLQFYRVIIMICEYLKEYDHVSSYVLIMDLQDTNLLDLATNSKLVDIPQFITILLKGYGVRVKAIYDISDSSAIQVLMKIFKTFLSEKIYNRIKILPKSEELHKYIPKEILPVEYGGNEKSIQALSDEWMKEISKPEYQEYMKMMNRAGTDESLRSSCKFNEEILGMAGSFRNLSVD